jgi:hypothetical protein
MTSVDPVMYSGAGSGVMDVMGVIGVMKERSQVRIH